MFGQQPQPYYNYNPKIHLLTLSIAIKDVELEQVKPWGHPFVPLLLHGP